MARAIWPYDDFMTNEANLARLRNLQDLIMVLATHSDAPVTAERVLYATYSKFTAEEVVTAIAAMRAFGVLGDR